MSSHGHEFTAAETAELLGELDRRLRRRGVAASIFVVGGAAVAAADRRRERLTADVDALTRDQVVIDEAKALARDRTLPSDWLNPNAQMWMPPLPAGVLEHSEQPGLRVTYADDGFLFATKLVAQRAKDAADLVLLAERLGLAAATPAQLEAHIRHYYTDSSALEFIVGSTDPDQEVTLLAQDAARMLRRTGATTDRIGAADAAAAPQPSQSDTQQPNPDRLGQSTRRSERDTSHGPQGPPPRHSR